MINKKILILALVVMFILCMIEIYHIGDEQEPNIAPTAKPTIAPTAKPTITPTAKPTITPTAKPTTAKPTTAKPTIAPKPLRVMGVQSIAKIDIDTDYKVLDIREPSGITSEQIDTFLYDTDLKGLGAYYIEAEKEHGVNAMFLVALSALESGWGSSGLAKYKNNLFGFGAYDSDPYNSAKTFKSKKQSILLVSLNIKDDYLNPNGRYYSGYTINDINKRYASSKLWDDKIISIMNRMRREILEESIK